MKQTTKKASYEKGINMGIPLLLIAFGILMIVNPALMQRIFMIISIVLLLIGLIEFVIYRAVLPYEKKPEHYQRSIALGITGGVMLLVYFLIATLIPFCIGALLCAVGMFGIRRSFALKAAKQAWQMPMVLNLLILGMGITILICTFSTQWIWMLTGILMVISGMLRLVNLFLENNASVDSKKPIIDAATGKPEA